MKNPKNIIFQRTPKFFYGQVKMLVVYFSNLEIFWICDITDTYLKLRNSKIMYNATVTLSRKINELTESLS